jgi:hypothetical protein
MSKELASQHSKVVRMYKKQDIKQNPTYPKPVTHDYFSTSVYQKIYVPAGHNGFTKPQEKSSIQLTKISVICLLVVHLSLQHISQPHGPRQSQLTITLLTIIKTKY